MVVNIHPIHLFIDCCYLLQGEGVILIDGGAPGKVEAFARALDGLSIDPRDVQLMIVTHGHWDHIARAKDIKALTGAKVAMHEQEKHLLENPLRPQWKSVTGHLKNSLPRKLSTGLPSQRCSHGIAPFSIVPPPFGNRQPITRS